ncbi:hypothetical protein [Micromonospora zamorensis]|uniref:hypothetical protein n=1 Tax=Micromonospora zamorensis TaxID=709883 RepID=UPI003CE83B55
MKVGADDRRIPTCRCGRAFDTDEDIPRALSAGTSGVPLKGTPPARIAGALHAGSVSRW